MVVVIITKLFIHSGKPFKPIPLHRITHLIFIVYQLFLRIDIEIMKRKLLPVIMLIFCLLTSFGAYQMGLKNGKNALAKISDEQSPDEMSSEVTPSGMSDFKGEGFSQLPPSLAPATSADLLQADSAYPDDLLGSFASIDLNSVLSSSDPVDRLFQLTGYLKTMDSSNVEDVVAAFENTKAGDSEWKLMLNSWSNFDPESAMSYLATSESLSSKRRGGLAYSVVENWAKSDPLQALEFVQSNQIGDSSSNKLAYTALSTALKSDLNTAIQMSSLLQDEKTRNYSMSRIADEYFKTDPVGAKFWAESIEDPGMKRGALDKITREMSEADPFGALEYALDQFGEKIPFSSAVSLSKNLSKEDPAFAIEYASGIENDKTRRYAVAQAVGEWAKSDPVSVAEFLNDQPSSAEWDAPVAAFARNAFDQDPAQAMGWAQTITDKRLRSSTIGSLYKDWSRQDRDAARAWAQSQRKDGAKSGD